MTIKRHLVGTWPATPLARLSVGTLVTLLLIGVFLFTRFWQMSSYSLWGGEAFTIIGVRQSWVDMFTYIVADIVHPPLFYILLKWWLMLGSESLFWIKLLPVVIGTAVVVPFLLLVRELNLTNTARNLSLLFISVNGYLIHYAQELRMYGLFTLLSTVSFWLFVRYYRTSNNGNKTLLALTITNLLLIYTHYYGWLVVVVEAVFILATSRQKIRRFGASGVFLGICFAPWAYLVGHRAIQIGGLASNLDWIPRPRPYHLGDLYYTFNGPLEFPGSFALGLLLFGVPVFWWGRLTLPRNWAAIRELPLNKVLEPFTFYLLAFLAFFPAIVLFLISHLTSVALWIDRYFIFIAIPYLMLVATAVTHIPTLWLKHTFIVALVIWSGLAGWSDMQSNRMAWEGAQMGSRVPWEMFANKLTGSQVEKADKIRLYTLTVVSKGLRTGDWALSTSLLFYLEALQDYRFIPIYARDVHVLMENLAEEDSPDHFWVGYFDLGAPEESAQTILTNAGYRVGETVTFRQAQNSVQLFPVWRE